MSNPPNATRVSYAYQLLMLFFCLYAISAVVVSALVPLPIEIARILNYIDGILCALFLADFLRHLYLADNRWRYFYTWGWIDLLSSIPMVDSLRYGRIVRLFRIFRILRAVRATKTLVLYLLETKVKSAFYSVVIVSFSMIVVSAIAVLLVEDGASGSNIHSAEDALWWAVTTITTVGYGDRFPVTSEGRAVAAMLMTAGVGLFGTLSGIVAAGFLGNRGQPQSPATPEEVTLAQLREEIAELRKEVSQHLNRP